MTRFLFVIVLAATLSSCAHQNGSQSHASKSKESNNGDGTARQKQGLVTMGKTEQDAAHIVLGTIQQQNVAQTVAAPGKLIANEDRTWRVGAIAPGKIDEVLAKVGDFVRAGQVLARIHSHDVHEVRAAYREATAELDRARSGVAYATQRRDRAKRLLELKAGARQDLESAENGLVDAEAAVAKAIAEVRKERIHLTGVLHVPVEAVSDTDPNGQQATDTEDIPVYAPASAVVFERKATVGSVVGAGDVLFSLTDTSSLWMIAAANETDLSALRTGQRAEIRVRAYAGKLFPGRILKLGEELDPVTRTLEVRILVPNPQGLLKPEMYASAAILQPEKRSAIFLTDSAIQDIDGMPAVFVKRTDTQFEARSIKTGQHANGETEISEGVHPGEVVVLKGAFLLKSELLKSRIQED
jgi:multidrug efflux pump subunit AcrA (membrane-fusion protein)